MPESARVTVSRPSRQDSEHLGDRLVTQLTQAHLAELYKLAAVLDELTGGQ